jgi:hypothetical protein
MTGGPHPMVAIMTTERRRKELLAEADRDRLVWQAQLRSASRPPWSHLSAGLVIVIALALVLVMSHAMS